MKKNRQFLIILRKNLLPLFKTSTCAMVLNKKWINGLKNLLHWQNILMEVT